MDWLKVETHCSSKILMGEEVQTDTSACGEGPKGKPRSKRVNNRDKNNHNKKVNNSTQFIFEKLKNF